MAATVIVPAGSRMLTMMNHQHVGIVDTSEVISLSGKKYWTDQVDGEYTPSSIKDPC